VLSPTATLTPLTTATSTGIAALTDLQALQSFFNLFSTEMGTAPTPTTPALLTFFDTTNFRQNGQKLAAFLQQITTNPKLLGGQLGFGAISLDTVPTWVTTVPSSATAAYKVHFTVLIGNSPNSRNEFVMYKDASGSWVALGNQLIAHMTGDNWICRRKKQLTPAT
jgi:hypothetical protein